MLKVIIFVYGIIIGSFLNVCIYRIPKKESIAMGRSYCPRCGNQILWLDLIPVFSYIFLGGKCRSCSEKISLRYPLVELSNGLIYLFLFTYWGLSIKFAGMAFLSSTLIVISLIDYEHKIIPNKIILVMIVVGIIYNIFNKELTVLDFILGFVAASLPLFIIAVLSNGGMGGGDIKLMAATGIFLGWKLILLSLFLGAIIGAVISLTLIVFKRRERKDAIPFGPFLSAGIFISIIYGSQILNWYWSIWTVGK